MKVKDLISQLTILNPEEDIIAEYHRQKEQPSEISDEVWKEMTVLFDKADHYIDEEDLKSLFYRARSNYNCEREWSYKIHLSNLGVFFCKDKSELDELFSLSWSYEVYDKEGNYVDEYLPF